MVSARHTPRCGHRDCNNRRSVGRTFCRACWAFVSHGLRARIARASERGDARALTEAVIEAAHEITARRHPAAPKVDPRTSYSLTAARMGEHDDEAAE